MATRQEHTLKTIYDRQLDMHAGYLVYFDNVCMNEFIKSYVTNIGISVGMSSASVTMLYAPQFKTIDTIDDYGGLLESEDGVQNGTNLRIFTENPFSRKYEIIFDGIIKGKSFARNPYGFELSFTATDYMYWLNRTVIPISIPFNEKVSSGDRIRWKGQGIDVDNVNSVNIVSAGQLTGKTINEYWYNTLKKSLLQNSTVFSDPNTVAVFDNAINRVELMGDINSTLVQQRVIDLVLTANATFADTAYVSLNNVSSNLLMEFFQDKDGVIRLKPPFWNEPVLKSHIIDPIMIKSGSENTNWNSLYTRVISQGGVEEWQTDAVSTSKPDLLTPVGVYVGNLKDKSKGQWADYLNYSEDYVVFRDLNSSSGDTSGFVGGQVGNSNAEQTTYAFLTGTAELNKAVAYGIMANINRESGFNILAEGDGGTSHGLCQWHSTRFYSSKYYTWPKDTSLTAFCTAKGYDWKTIEAQLRYLIWDISSEGSHPIDFSDCEDSVQGARKAAEKFCREYEGPKNVDIESASRASLAEQYYNNFGQSTYEMYANNSTSSGSRPSGSSQYNINQCMVYTKGVSQKISTHFNATEFQCRGTTCGCRNTYIAKDLVEILERIRSYYGGKGVNINSGYRCANHNNNVGGASDSIHLSGAAADIQVTGVDARTVFNDLNRLREDPNSGFVLADGTKINGLIYYPKYNFVHVDIGNRKWIDANGHTSAAD